MKPSLRGVNWRLIGYLVALVFFAFGVVALFSLPIDWSALRESLYWEGVTASLLLLAVGQAIRGLMGWATATGFGQSLTAKRSYVSWHLSQMAKYVPGGVWLFPARAVMYSDYGMAPAVSAAVVLWELTIVLVAGIVLALLGGAGFLIGGWGVALALLGAAALTLVLWSPSFWRWLAIRGVEGAHLIAEPLKAPLIVRLRFAFWPTLVAVLSWLLIGLAFHILLISVDRDVALSWFESAGRYAAAWVAGFIVIFAPAGLGVREATLTLALTPAVGGPTALAIALAARVWWAIVEVFHVLGASALKRGRLVSAGSGSD